MVFKPVVFRPMFGRVLTIAMAAVVALALSGFVATGDWAGLLRHGWLPLLLLALTWAMFWAPRLEVHEHEVTVRNVLSTVHVPWTAIQRIDTKYALTLHTPAGAVAVWAAPAPSRYAALGMTRADAGPVAESARLAGTIRPGDALNTPSGAAAHVVRLRWERLRDEGFLEGAVVEEGSLRHDWHWRSVAMLAALLLATLLGLAL